MKTVLKTAVCLLVLTGTGAFAQSQARFAEVRGTVEIQNAGSTAWRPVSPGDVIGKNAVISTGFKSTALISIGDSRISVRPLTRLTLEELVQRDGAEKTDLYLRTGRIRAEVTPPAGLRGDFTVRSPSATASVRGTEFEFDTVHLSVDNGRVLMEGAGGRVYVDAGQRSYVDQAEQRLVPSSEAETARLTPVLAELAGTGAAAAGSGPRVAASAAVSVTAEW
ncbi:MAG: FecR family protein [Treponema sp.]|jgi:hypothetical protein|nr:FecR family protein [Treponema sp.]